ncbi:MAG TPA: hypothetical protein DEP18_06680 [Flavobacteriales bacterium]|nr:hypothetical protein [Flavobacteriales bacterium]
MFKENESIMKKVIGSLLAVSGLLSCGGNNTTVEKEVIVKTDTVVITEQAPRDSFMVFGHIEFPSTDGLTISASSYEVIPSEDYIILCHQAGYSRGEYREIAKELNKMGYNCLAIDQRSGDKCNDMINETASRAKKDKKSCEYADAEQDILSAIDFVHKKTNHPIILWGSSYSASLALKIAKGNEKVSAVVAFSPGEYLKGTNLSESISGLDKPVFATGAKKEMKDIDKVLSGVTSPTKQVFTPSEEGVHGSSALWPSTANNAEYWTALKAFLDKLSPAVAENK